MTTFKCFIIHRKKICLDRYFYNIRFFKVICQKIKKAINMEIKFQIVYIFNFEYYLIIFDKNIKFLGLQFCTVIGYSIYSSTACVNIFRKSI